MRPAVDPAEILEELHRAAPTFGAAWRVLLLLRLDPGRQGGGRLRSRAGIVWECRLCHREYDDERPAQCAVCRSRTFSPQPGSVYYLRPSGGGDYYGGLDAVNFAVDLERWCYLACGPVRGHSAVLWLSGASLRTAALQMGLGKSRVHQLTASARDYYDTGADPLGAARPVENFPRRRPSVQSA